MVRFRRTLRLGLLSACLLTGVFSGSASASTRATAEFRAARQQWVAAQLFSGGAYQAVPLMLVVADLHNAIADGANRSRYSGAIDVLVRFGRLPDASLTPVENKAFNADFAAIDHFFGFTNSPWKSGCIAHGPGLRSAATSWLSEPAGTHSGISIAPLKAAAHSLQKGLSTDQGDLSCYPAAISDLQALTHVTATQLKTKPDLNQRGFADPSTVNTAWAEIAWINAFLGLNSNQIEPLQRLTA